MKRTATALGNVISSLRQSRGLSQEAFADLAGIHRTYVSQLERGLKTPTVLVLMKIARALQTRSSHILRLLEQRLDEVSDTT